MSIERAKDFFRMHNLEYKIKEFEVSSATVELAAAAINCEPQRIAKSITFIVDNIPVLIVAAGDAKVDNKKYKSQFNKKAKMLSPIEVETLIGHTIGGVCPFGINDNVDVYLDISLKRFETVFPACGSSNSVIELTLGELEKYSGYKDWIDVCKGWKE